MVFKDGTNAQAKAEGYGVEPDFVYRHALSGFAAPLGDRKRARIEADPDTLMVTFADRAEAPQTMEFAKEPTPIEQFPQQVPRGIRRIGGLLSPTAKIDGVDERVGVDVAVLDSGIDPKQPDLNVRGGTGCIGGRGFDDVAWHGTMVAGVVGALDNAFGAVGVAPGARLWSVRVLDEALEGTDANLLCGIDWVTKHSDRIEVANLSLGDIGSDDGNCGLENHDPVHWAICHSVSAGVTHVVAAGNETVDAAGLSPASYDEVITASALSDTDGQPGGLGPESCEGTPDDVFAFFSNFGADIDLAAPGVCVGSTFPDGQLAISSGTSFSTPHVAGAAALYVANHPHASPNAVRQALRDARERTALSGDPDGIAEGIVNVSSF